MTHQLPYEDYEEHVTEMEHSDPAFWAERERLSPGFEFGKALIAARLAAGLTQRQLAQKMGTSQAAIARLETGARLPTVDTLYRLAGILRLDFTITSEEPLRVQPHRAA